MDSAMQVETPHVLQNAGVVAKGNQHTDSTALTPSSGMFAGMTRQEREVAVTTLVQRASEELRQAALAGEPADVMAAYKDQAAAIADLSKRIDVSKDAVLDAQVLQRRAERGLGVAIRVGQEDGSITTVAIAAQQREARRRGTMSSENIVPSPRDFATHAELNGGLGGNGIYALADNGTATDFEEALTEAREEGNVSRANVVRKLNNAASGRDAKEERRVSHPTDTDARSWHANLAVKYPLPRFAFEAEGKERHATLAAFQEAATRYGAKYRFHEKSYAKHAAQSQDRLNRSTMSIEVAIDVLSHIDFSTITPEQAAEALQRIDVRSQLGFYIRSLKEIINE